MFNPKSQQPTRRSFLKSTGAAAGLGVVPSVGLACSSSSETARRAAAGDATNGSAPLGIEVLELPSEPTGPDELGDRTLVCVFLAGGADSFNMFVPADFGQEGSTYDTYRATRGDIAAERSQLLEVSDGSFGFHPNLPGLRDLYDRGDLGVVANVGPLVAPTTAADFDAKRDIPQSLFAHDAQQNLWQTAAAQVAGANFGWGAGIAREVAQHNDGASVGPAFSIAGSNVWQADADGQYLRLHPTTLMQRLDGYDPSLRAWIDTSESRAEAAVATLTSAEASDHPLLATLGSSIRRSIATTEQLEALTQDGPDSTVDMGDYGRNGLASQLHMVARLIRARRALGHSRQVFFVHMGGWDTHSDQNERLPVLLDELDQALTLFQGAIDAMGAADSVTTFTASDFGRTLTSNGNGTDHAWGGHSFVLGGGVAGGRYHGTMPSFDTVNNPDDVGEENGFGGRLIPTTSVGQLGAQLAQWCGVTPERLPGIFPGLDNFDLSQLDLFTGSD